MATRTDPTTALEDYLRALLDQASRQFGVSVEAMSAEVGRSAKASVLRAISRELPSWQDFYGR